MWGQKQNINRKRQKKHEMNCSAGSPGCPFVCDSLNFVLKGTGTRLSQLALLPLNTKRTCSNPGSTALFLQSFSVDDTALFQCSSFCPRSQISTFIVHIFLSVFNKCCSLISDLISIFNRTLLLL